MDASHAVMPVSRDAMRDRDARNGMRDAGRDGLGGVGRDAMRDVGRDPRDVGRNARDARDSSDAGSERGRERERTSGYWWDDKGRKDGGRDAHGRHRDSYGDSRGSEKSPDLKRSIDINKQIMGLEAQASCAH